MSASFSSSFSSSFSELSEFLFATLDEKELSTKNNTEKDILSSLNETEKNFIKNVLNKAIVTPDPSGTSVKVHVMDVDFFVQLDKKDFFNTLVLGSTSSIKPLEQRIAETVYSITRNFLMWVTESMVPNLFEFNVISKLEIFNSIQKTARAIEDEWKRSIWQNKYYYTSVVYKGNDWWTVHIARYVDHFSSSSSSSSSSSENEQQRQPFISCRFSPDKGVEFWNHKRLQNNSVGITSTKTAGKSPVLLIPLLVSSDKFKTMLEEIGAWEGGDVYLLSIILLFKMLFSKKNFVQRDTSSAIEPSTTTSTVIMSPPSKKSAFSEWTHVSRASAAKKETYADRLKK